MKNFILLLTCAGLVLTVALCAKAQEEKKLTNEKVLKMIKAEVPESTVLLAIEADPSGLDTSADALIKMNEGGASKSVLDAMVAAKNRKTAPAVTPTAVPVGAVPNFNDVTLVSGDKRISLKRGGQMKASAAPFVGSTVRQVFEGAVSPTRVKAGDISFEFFQMGNSRPEESISLVIPEVRKKDRRVETNRAAGFMVVSTSSGKKTLVPVKYEKISDNNLPGMSAPKYRLIPQSKLAPGEYVLITNNQFFDFGVDAE